MKKYIEDPIENGFDPFKLLINSETESEVESYKKLVDYYLAQVGNPKLKILGVHFMRKVLEHEPDNPDNYLKLARLEYASGYAENARRSAFS